MNREEFVAHYMVVSGLDKGCERSWGVEKIGSIRLFAVPCPCDKVTCPGWMMTSQPERFFDTGKVVEALNHVLEKIEGGYPFGEEAVFYNHGRQDTLHELPGSDSEVAQRGDERGQSDNLGTETF